MALPALPVTSVAFRLTDEELRNSPSRAHGVDEATEFSLRIYGAELVQEAGILLKQPQAVMATAQVLFQRFYCKRSFVEFNRLAAASVFLAAKLEEAHPQVRARDVINVFYRQERRHEGKSLAVLDMFGRRYEELKAELLRCERHMLREFGFLALLEHPHKFVLNYCQLLELPPPVTQTSWALANDSLRTTLCVRFSPEALACGCIFLAARKAAVPLPEEPYSAWWTLFGAHREEVLAIAKVLLVLIDQPKSEYIHVGPSPAGATPPPSPPRPPPPPPQAQAPMPQQGSRGGGGGGGREGRRRSRSRSGERERGRREGRRSRSRSRSRSPRGRRYEEEDRRRRERSRSRSRRRSRSRSRGGR